MTVSVEEIVANQRIIWRCLHRHYPGGDRNGDIRRFGTLDDLGQECLLFLIEQRGKFDPARATLSTWMYLLTWARARRVLHSAGVIRTSSSPRRNEVDEQARQKARGLASLSRPSRKAMALCSSDGRQDEWVTADVLDLREALRQIHPAHARLLRRTFMEGEMMSKLAEEEGVSHQAIQARRWKAIAALRRHYEGGGR